jgi:hypothetical protein
LAQLLRVLATVFGSELSTMIIVSTYDLRLAPTAVT